MRLIASSFKMSSASLFAFDNNYEYELVTVVGFWDARILYGALQSLRMPTAS